MGKKLDLEDLKKEYIGKTFNWLTILDVISTCKTLFRCKCKCGKVLDVYYRYVSSGRQKSCGCYIHSE